MLDFRTCHILYLLYTWQAIALFLSKYLAWKNILAVFQPWARRGWVPPDCSRGGCCRGAQESEYCSSSSRYISVWVPSFTGVSLADPFYTDLSLAHTFYTCLMGPSILHSSLIGRSLLYLYHWPINFILVSLASPFYIGLPLAHQFYTGITSACPIASTWNVWYMSTVIFEMRF